MKRVRIAQIGVRHDHALDTAWSITCVPELELVGVIPLSNEDEEIMATKPFYSRVPRLTLKAALAMDGLDAVAIECEEEKATEYAQLFADKGVHIHLDKPGTHGADSFERLVETCRQKGLVLQMGYMYRYNPTVRHAMALVRAGELGDIYAVEAHMDILYMKEKREWLRRHKGGMMYFLGCHDIDLVLQFMGELPTEVIPLSCSTGQYGLDCEDYGFAVLSYPSGPSFVKTTCCEHGGYDRRQIVICGSRGTVEIRPVEKPTEHTTAKPGSGYLSGARIVIDGKVSEYQSDCFDRYDGMMQAFADHVLGRSQNPYTYDYELALFKTVMKACGAK